MRYKPTILGIAAWLFLGGCIIYTIINYPTLSAGEGWGILYMIGLAGIGVVALVIDFIIQLFSGKR